MPRRHCILFEKRTKFAPGGGIKAAVPEFLSTTVGCALCSVLSPGTCDDQCVTAGLYCGVSEYACRLEKE
jgi:hypothetical protein